MRVAVIAILLVLTVSASASEPRLPPGVTCDDVRAKVAEYGESLAYAWARLHGYIRAEIREARKCLR
jgi:hypothetical protein